MDLSEIDSNGMVINQLNGNPLDGSLNQLYLRVYTSEGIRWTPMVGSNSASKFGYSTAVVLVRRVLDVHYQSGLATGRKIAGLAESS